MDPSRCVPSDKHDHAAVRRAEAAGFPALDPVIPALLAWVQDINWPVAPPLAALLSEAGAALVEPVRAVLEGDDGMWKYWVIHHVLMQAGPDVLGRMQADLLRLAEAPTADDRDSEAHLAAREVLAQG